MAHKYKNGDKVVVRSDLCVDERYRMEDGSCGNSLVEEMREWAGKVVTVTHRGSQYSIKEDGGRWGWTDEMFEGLATEAKPEAPQSRPKFKVGDLVIGHAKANGTYSITKQGWVGTIVKVISEERILVEGPHENGLILDYSVDAYCFDLLVDATPAPEQHTDWNWEDLF